MNSAIASQPHEGCAATGRAERRVAFVTLGCAKNEVDTSHMKRRLRFAGYTVVEDVDDADAVVVNTCSFIQSATEESIDVIFEMAQLPKVEAGEAHLVVAGCMPARYGDSLEDELTEARAFVPCSREDDIACVLDGVFGFEGEGEGAAQTAAYRASGGFAEPDFASSAFAYVKISDGCDRRCAYCVIPSIRGSYRSFSYEDIRAEVALRVEEGAREIVLIAQDTGRWGCDFPEKRTLAWLLEQLAEEFADIWLRVLYLEPEGVTDELLAVMAAHDNICSYLDIPLQHVNSEVLRSMNRAGSRKRFEDLFARIQAAVPGITLRTTLIAGFPGETEEQFEELCDFVEESPFSYIGVFAYSREEGTAAYDLPDQVDEDEKLQRAQVLRDIADAVCTSRVAERVGKRCEVLVEGVEEDGQVFGRTQAQAPEVDGVTYVDSGEVGCFVPVTIADTLMYEMEGER